LEVVEASTARSIGARRGGGWLRRARPILGLLFLALALWLVARFLSEVGWREVGARLGAAHRGWILVAVALNVLQLWLWGFRWKLAIRRVDPTPRRRVIYTALAAAAAVNHVAPFARLLGGWLRARYLARAGQLTLSAVYGVVLFDQVSHLVVMLTLTLLALVGGALLAHNYVLAAGMAAAAAALGGVGTAWIGNGEGGRGRVLRRFARSRLAEWGPARALARRGGETVAMFARLAGDRALRWQVTGLGLVIYAVSVGAQTCVFRALGESPSPLVVAVTVSLGIAAGTLAGTPGGIGAAEAAMLSMYVALGVDSVTAAAAALLYRSLYYLVVLTTGLPSALLLEWKLVRSPAR
jgi:uncharacterized membrane protein YbhN (UPF0104 family)